ncbi:hypothetical protein [Trueperella abortisuis]|uniref:Uncharacterized protein n=1 Tax=Trueperella abortisuis TaxID=445930 RepID=A0ABT9PJ42_9ACTO|nr:hypothetical protein [Trueperella abortisuis]MDP9832734.1 hypothetical protein [Trueperella abortisuis]
MRRKIASAASAALLIGGIAMPATATAAETSPFDSDLSSWLAPGSQPPAEKETASPSGDDLSSWLAPTPKPATPKTPEDKAPESKKAESTEPAAPEAGHSDLSEWLAPGSSKPADPEIKAPSGDDLGSWLAPSTPKPQDPKQGEPKAGEKASDTPVIAELAFGETQHGRTLSWKVDGCSVLNKKTVKVSLSRGTEALTVRGQSRKESTNASTWPAGTYTLTARCVNMRDGKELGKVTKDVELTRSNMWVSYSGDPLYGLVPNPGERVTLTTHAPANALPIKAGPYEPGETVVVRMSFGEAEATEITRANADDSGHLTLDQWLPQRPAGAKSFTLVAQGESSKRATTYTGTLIDSPRSAFEIVGVEGRTVKVGPTAMEPNASGFTEPGALPASVLGPDGNEIAKGELTVDAKGAIGGSVTLPDGDLPNGRYTLRVLSPLGIRGYHADYFVVKNNVVYRGWAIPADDVDTPAPGAQPGQPEAPEGGNAGNPEGKDKLEGDKEQAPAPETDTAVTPSPDQKVGSKEHKAGAQAPMVDGTTQKNPVVASAPAKAGKSEKSLAHAGAGVVGLGALGAAVTALGALLVRRCRSEG